VGVAVYVMDSLINNRYFPLAQLGLAAVAGIIWYLWPEAGWYPVLVALLPWGLRLAAGRKPFEWTPFDVPVLLFLLTAGVGVWAAYDRETAWGKFWLVVGAVFIYYALAAQPRDNWWLVMGLFGALAATVAVYFVFTHDFELYPAKVDLFNRIGLAFMRVRPSLPAHLLHPNVAGGLMAIFGPCLAAVSLRAGRRRQWGIAALAAAGGGLVILSLLLTTSRGAWLAFAAGMGIWALRGLSGTAAGLTDRPRQQIFWVALGGVAAIAASFVLTYPGGPMALANSLPGPANAGSRLELARHTWELAADVPFTGAGLGSFPGLYSQYIVAIPFGVLIHAHNVYLDVSLEQGVIALLSLLAIMVGTIGLVSWLPRPVGGRNSSLLRWAIITGVLIHAIHGLVEDPLYGSRGVVLLLVWPGLAVALWQGETAQPSAESKRSGDRWTVPALVVVLLLAAGFLFWPPAKGAWYANLGAVEMARQELTGWPHNKWDEGENVERLAWAETLLQQAIAADPNNSAARYRLGLIAMLRRDYVTAVSHLEVANQNNNNHRGIRKALGYSYAWVGEFDRGGPLLAAIPEARSEMNIYIGWWGNRGRADLSQLSAQMVAWLDGNRPAVP
jgi:hypothetical protein